MAAKKQVILGGPGTGKTTALMGTIEKHLEGDVDPNRIGFFTFTRAGANVAVERAIARFNIEKPKYFRTLHSLSYGELGLSQSEVMTYSDYKEIAKMTGIPITFRAPKDGVLVGSEGDKFMNIISLARATCRTLKETWETFDEFIEWKKLKYFNATIEGYKKEVGKLDYSDMLDEYIANQPPPDLDVLVIDEAQDLSTVQWKLVDKLSGSPKFIYYAGDDDQAIYRWSGADIGRFLALGNDSEKKVLPISYRLPNEVYREAQTVAKRISKRYEKRFRPADHDGHFGWLANPQEIDLRKGNWMLLARNNVSLSMFVDVAEAQGVPYSKNGVSSVKEKHIKAIQAWEHLRKGELIKPAHARNLIKHLSCDMETVPRTGMISMDEIGPWSRGIWHESLDLISFNDRQYYIEMLRNGYKLTRPPEVKIGTIHSVKGDEADNVVVATDMTWRSYDSYTKEPDDEHRVFYVGMTRARKSLQILSPQTSQSYPL